MIKGYLFEKNSAANQEAVLVLFDEIYNIKVDNEIVNKGEISKLSISNRLANTQRKITLESGEIFATLENDLIDELILKKQKSNNFLYKLENNLFLILVSLIVTIFFVFAVYKWGIPYSSKKIAHTLPFEATKIVSKHSIEVLDEYLFKESKISKDEQNKILLSFKKKLLPLVEDKDKNEFRILFRNWTLDKKEIANALALPDGTIILTDKLIKLSKNQEELDSVILHEIGHVYHRHGMQNLAQSAFTALITMYITGDLNGFAQMGVSFATTAVYNKYSRDHENEADIYSFNKMIEAKIDPIHFSNIMKKISSTKELSKESNDFLSTHPNTLSRVQKAELYSQCFKDKNKCSQIDKIEK